MTKCPKCNENITIRKINGIEHMVIGGKIDFVPSSFSEELFVSLKGSVQKGQSAPDGIKGYRLHQCIEQ